jgi:hypothetical protein
VYRHQEATMHTETTQEPAMKSPLPIEREIVLRDANFVHGVTHDGRRVWVATDDGQLIAIDPERGVEVTRHRDFGCDAGLAFDGESLWVICGDEIRRVDPDSGKVLSRIPAPEHGEVSGMAFAEGSLWIGQYRQQTVLKVDPKTGAVLKKIPRDRMITGVSFVDGELWYGSVSGDEQRPAAMLHQVDPETLEERGRYAYPETMWISGLEIDPGKRSFWAGGHVNGTVRVLSRPDKARARGAARG